MRPLLDAAPAEATPARAPSIGSLVARRYRVVARLHSGGSGSAHVAVDEKASGARRLVVLEALRADPEPARAVVEAFIAEATIRTQMNHPNVVRTYELAQHEGLPIAVTEYLEGESLATLLALAFGMPEFSLEVRLAILAQAVRGLRYIHELRDVAGRPSGLVHGSISPHDIVIGYDGSVRLAGFGSAAAGAARRRSNAAITPVELEYLAPEQLKGVAQRPADVFAMGVLLWELVALQRFWNHLPEYEVRRRLVAFDIPDIARLKPNVGGELARICRLALAADPAHRYPSAVELLVDLDRYLLDRSAVVSPSAIAQVMVNACGSLQRETRQVLGTAVDSARQVVPSGAPRRRDSTTDAGLWDVLTKRELPRATPTTAAWAACAVVAFLVAVAVQRARNTEPELVETKPVSTEPVAIDPIVIEAAENEPVPSEGLEHVEALGVVSPSSRSSTTAIQTLAVDPTVRARERRSPANVAPRPSAAPLQTSGVERRRLAEPDARVRKTRGAESTPTEAARGRDGLPLTIRLER